MSIILTRLPQQDWSYGSSLAEAKHCRLDPSSSQHAAYVDAAGVLHYQHIDTSTCSTTQLLRFQLQYSAGEGLPFEPISKPWRFEFVPGMPGDVLLVQEGSCRILYASFPRQGSASSDVFLFGSHTAPIRSFITNGNVVLSGCEDGVVKLWRMSDGQLADLCNTPDRSGITATAFLGPLLVAAGTASSSITLYDTSSGRLLAVQRFLAGPGAVDCMAAWVPPAVLAAANLAPCGPLPPDGGAVLASTTADGLSGGGASPCQSGSAMLAVASSTGWLCVFAAPQQPGSTSTSANASSSSSHNNLSLLHSTGSLIAPGANGPSAQLAFSSDGSTLIVASAAAQLIGSEAVAAAAAGSLPGSVSLYQVAAASESCIQSGGGSGSGAGSFSAMLPPLLLQQQQDQHLRQPLPDLQLWHQWSLCSTPVGVSVLPGSTFKLLAGKQLQPTQVLQLYVLPEVGPGQVLCAERKMIQASSSSRAVAQPDSRQRAAAAGDVTSNAPVAVDAAAAASGAVHSSEQQQQQHSRASVGSVSSSSSRMAQQQQQQQQQHSDQEDDEALLLNLAERDLAEVAHAIAAAAGPLHDAELEALLAGMTADFSALASAQDHSDSGTVAQQQQSPAAAAGTLAAGVYSEPAAAETAETAAHATVSDTATEAAGAQEAAVPGAPVGGGALRLPQTLPKQRSWLDAGAGVGARAVDLTALAQELQEEQQRLLQQQQQQQQQQQLRERERELAQKQQQERAQAEQHQNQRQGLNSEQELPSETSFQQILLQAGRGDQHQQQQGQQQHQDVVQQQQHAESALAVQPIAAEDRQHTTEAVTAAATEGQKRTAAAAAGSTIIAPAGTATGGAADADGRISAGMGGSSSSVGDAPPQPRQLPAMLRPAAAVAAQPPPAAADARSGAVATQQRAPAVMPGTVSAAAAGGAAAAGAAEAQAQRDPAATAQTAGLQHQQQPQQQKQKKARDQQQQPSLQERLNLRRQQLLARRQPPTLLSAALNDQQQQGSSSGGGAAAAAARASMRCSMPDSDHPLAAAVQNSSRLLAAKIQEAEKAPDVTVDPSGPAALKLAAALLCEHLDLPLEQQQYSYEELPDLKDVATPTCAPKLVPKQLDAQWVASRSLKPSMDTLFKPQDWQQGFVDPQVLVLPGFPTPQQVVEQLLWPGQGQ